MYNYRAPDLIPKNCMVIILGNFSYKQITLADECILYYNSSNHCFEIPQLVKFYFINIYILSSSYIHGTVVNVNPHVPRINDLLELFQQSSVLFTIVR